MGDPANPANWRTLDIPQRHVLQTCPGAAHGFAGERRILCYRIEHSRWIAIDPEGAPQSIDLGVGRVVVLGRNAPFPADRVAAGEFQAYYGQAPDPMADFPAEMKRRGTWLRRWG